MRNALKMISVLTVLGLVSGLTLALMYKYTAPRIEANQKNETEKAIFEVFPEGKDYETKTMNGNELFEVKDKNGKVLGYAFVAEGNGYQGTIKLMAGLKTDLETLAGIEVLESQETPGLGQEITTPSFRGQFNALKAVPAIEYVKNERPSKPNQIQAITGATVSSSAVVSILNEKIKKINKK